MTATNGLDLNLVTAFVRVVEEGSFTTAAQKLGLPKSSVSRRVTALERALRARLLQRSTRKLVLTEAGRLYFERARAALGGLADAGAAVTDLSGEAAGPIRFTAASSGGFLAKLLAEFLFRHPKVQLDVVLTPRRVDLVAEGFDLALRAGPLVDSALIARRLGRTELGLFASRAYLRKEGRPQRIADLAHHRFVLFGEPHERENLRLTGPAGEESVKISGPIVVHELSFGAELVATGLGIGLMPVIDLARIAKGGPRPGGPRDLVRVLPDYGLVTAELSLVSPPTAYEPTRVGLLRDFLTEKLRPMIQACTLAMEADKTARREAEERARRERERRGEVSRAARARRA